MKKWTLLIVAVLCIFVVGCAQQPESENASGAIAAAKKLENVEAQVNYLVKEANAFISSEQFDEAINSAKYILKELDAESIQAKSIIEKAQVELKAYAEKKAAEAKAELAKKMESLKL
jgi:hypothetical protein